MPGVGLGCLSLIGFGFGLWRRHGAHPPLVAVVSAGLAVFGLLGPWSSGRALRG